MNKKMNTAIDRKDALSNTLSLIEKQFGQGSIMRLGDRPSATVDTVSTGSLSIDMALGIGGLPFGRIIEIYGHESSGKTTLALSAIAQCQKNGGSCAFIDAEHALDPVYAKQIGVDTNELLLSQPDSGEQALEIADTLVRSGAINLIVIDSVAALVPKSELDGTMESISVGTQARLMSKALRKITGSMFKTGCMVIFINQIRMKINTTPYGSPETTTGGNALKFYASIRMEIKRGKHIMKGDTAVGVEVNVKIVKNKLSPPFKKVETELIFGHGISKEGEIVAMAERLGVIDKAGSWYSYDNNRIGQGKENVRQYLIDNPNIAAALEAAVRAKSSSTVDTIPEMSVDERDIEE